MNKMIDTKQQFCITPNEVIFDLSLELGDRAVYLALRSYRNEATKQPVYPSLSTLAKRIGCSVDTVARAIKRLEIAGHLSHVKGHSGRSNTYQFIDKSSYTHSRTRADTLPASTQAPISMDADKLPAQARNHPYSYNQTYKPEKRPSLFHGRDQAYIEEGGEVTIKLSSGDRVPWSHYDVESFSFDGLKGEQALLAARKAFGRTSGTGMQKLGNIIALSTNEEDFDSSRQTGPLFNNSNG